MIGGAANVRRAHLRRGRLRSTVTAFTDKEVESLFEAHARRVQQAAGAQNRRRRRTSDHDCVASDSRRAGRQTKA